MVTKATVDNYPVNLAQKVRIKQQLLACKLLELLINNTIENAAELIEKAREKTRNMLAKLFVEPT